MRSYAVVEVVSEGGSKHVNSSGVAETRQVVQKGIFVFVALFNFHVCFDAAFQNNCFRVKVK